MLSVQHLGLPTVVEAHFKDAELDSYQACSNLTYVGLESMSFTRSQAEKILGHCDNVVRKRFRNEMFFPHLPEVCYWIELEALELPAPVLDRLHSRQIDYFYQLAFQRRPTVLATLGISEKVAEFLVTKLDSFVTSYRQGIIVLEEE